MQQPSAMKKVKQAVSLSPFRLNSLLRLQKDPKLALRLFSIPNPYDKKPSFRYTLLSYDLIITKLGRARMFHEMEQILDQLRQETRFVPKEIIFCNVITSYGRAKLPDKAFLTFHRIPSFRCERTVKSLNTLLNALLVCREYEKMRELFVGMHQYACPDACTYNILIKASCLYDDLGNAQELFDEMLEKGVQPSVVTFGTLINVLCLNEKLKEAFRLKRDMISVYKVKPNAFVYVPLIKGLCRINEVDAAMELKNEMVRYKVELDSAVYSTLISALFKVGRKAEVSELLEDMRKNGCKLDTVTYNTLISGFCKDGDFDSALGVLEEMDEKGCKPDVISHNVIISALCKEGKVKEANDLFEDMPRRRCAPDVVTYRALHDGLCRGMKFKEAACILDEMVFKGYAPCTASINELVAGLSQEGNMELLCTVLSCLTKRDIIDADTWRMAMSAVCREDKLSSAWNVLDTLIMPHMEQS